MSKKREFQITLKADAQTNDNKGTTKLIVYLKHNVLKIDVDIKPFHAEGTLGMTQVQHKLWLDKVHELAIVTMRENAAMAYASYADNVGYSL